MGFGELAADSLYILKSLVAPEPHLPTQYEKEQVKPQKALEYRLTEEEMDRLPMYAWAGGDPQDVRIKRHTNLGPREQQALDGKTLADSDDGSIEYILAMERMTRGYYGWDDQTGPDSDSLNLKLLNDLGYMASPDTTGMDSAMSKYKFDLASNDINVRFELGKRYMNAAENNPKFYNGALDQFEWIAYNLPSDADYRFKSDLVSELMIIFTSSDEQAKERIRKSEMSVWNIN